MLGMRAGGLAVVALTALCCAIGGPSFAQSAPAPAIAPLAQRATIRIALSTSNIYPLTVLYALDKGYFAKAGLDVQVTKYTLAAVTLAPMLARGDLDLAPQTESPSFFNLANQGFGVKAVATFNTVKAGREEDTWILLSKDQVGKIKDVADLKGKVVEGGPLGSGAHFLVLTALKNAGLVAGKDVTVTNRARAAGDFLALAKSNSQDAIGMIEPQATQAEKEGYGKRWKSLSDVAPWAQTVVLATSESFLAKNGPALRKFLEVYVMAAREIDATNGVWNDDVMRIVSQWTQLSPDILRDMGGVPFVSPNPEVSADSMARSQQLWIENQVLQQAADVKTLIDPQPMADALAAVGRAP